MKRAMEMHYKHIMIETYCIKNIGDCNLFPDGVNCRCFDLNCKDLRFTPCANEFAYTDENGIATTWIGFGGDMDLSCNDFQRSELLCKWEEICKIQIENAYNQYMSEVK